MLIGWAQFERVCMWCRGAVCLLTVLHRRLGGDGAAARRVRSERGRARQRAVDAAARSLHLRPRPSLSIPRRTVSRLRSPLTRRRMSTRRRKSRGRGRTGRVPTEFGVGR